MHTALIIMTILGCDDSASQCHYVAQAEGRWETVSACDAATEARLQDYSGSQYPVVIAVCQPPSDTPAPATASGSAGAPSTSALAAATPSAPNGGMADTSVADGQVPVPPMPVGSAEETAESAQSGFIAKAISEVRGFVPARQTITGTLAKPVHVVKDGYSWVVRRF